MRRAAKIDRNQPDIVKALRYAGATVQPIHTIGKGCPDLLVGFRGENYILEIKDGSKPPSQRELTDDEKKWIENWKGKARVVSTIDEALDAVGA